MVAAVAGALAGAHRTATSIDRFRDWAHASDGSFQLNDDSQIADLQPPARGVAAGRADRPSAGS